MNSKFISLVVGFIIVGALMVFQATRTGAALMLIPSELIAKGPDATVPRLRVAGRVADKEIRYTTAPQIRLEFAVEDPKHPERGSVPVVYEGVKPDLFSPGRDVLIDGEFSGGVIRASGLLTQCPSKYEAPDPEKKYQQAATSDARQPSTGSQSQ
ncbi:MAG: cytochrome c maturation protein CcmE [Proteobacteria bacterium]|nr:cytochrome c maturation protein CcmE [Pseudomonadota bacterium]